MNKGEKKELAALLETMAKGLSLSLNNQENFSENLNRIIKLISFLMKNITVMFFILNLLIWKVFFWDVIKQILNELVSGWESLSENYKILLLGFIGTIIAGTIAHILGSLLLEKIKKLIRS